MTIRLYLISFVSLILLAPAPWARADATGVGDREYQVKAAFVYNFLKFVDWPKAKMGESNEPIIIGIIGNDVFQDAFEILEKKTVEGRKVLLRHFRGIEEFEKAGKKEPSGPQPKV